MPNTQRPIRNIQDLRMIRVPAGYSVQRRTISGDWRTLRPITIRNSEPHYMLGHDFMYELHPLSSLVPFMLEHEFDVDTPLPDALTQHPVIDSLPLVVRGFLTDYTFGATVEEALHDAGLTLADAAPTVTTLADAGIHIVRAAQIKDVLAEYDRVLRRPVVSSPDEPEVDGTPGPAVGQIVPITEEDIRRLERRAGRPLDELKGNRRWPFALMAENTRVIIDAVDATRAQRAAHVYAARTKRRFKTMREPSTGKLFVYRLADKPEGG